MRTKRYIDDPALDIMGNYAHDVSFLAPNPVDVEGLYLQVHRAGIATQLPEDFQVTRNDSYIYNVIHCVFRGKGTVTVRGQSHQI
ncbi:MAG: hypothetical protein IJA26_05975, partial [Clostridia bacterium]|nr:hypothetical protein [Clostridia bacterium]